MAEDSPCSYIHASRDQASVASGPSQFSTRRPQATPSFAALAGNIVHLWVAPLDLPPAELIRFGEFLSQSERERSARFYFERHRTRYIAAHAWVRLLLSQYLSVPPGQLRFEHGPKGKPLLADFVGHCDLEFNLSHSEDLAIIGVGRGAALGVDLECIREVEDAQELVARFFSKREATAFQALSQDQKPAAFFNLWTRKEAWLKATGEGIAHLLDQVEVSFIPGEPARLLTLPKGYSSPDAWSIDDLEIGEGFAAAVAVAAPQTRSELYWTNQLNHLGL